MPVLSRRADPVLGKGSPSLARWVGLCSVAEAAGMTAAAGAARTSYALVGEPAKPADMATALALTVAGGLVEGVALGGAQAAGLAHVLPAGSRPRWVVVTVAVAGVGWAAASAPAVLAGPSRDGAAPPVPLVLAGAGALGTVMGAALGLAQAAVLRPHVERPWRWVVASAAGWGPAMAVIFAGATAPDADWPTPAVVALGTVTGAAAGGVLGLVSGPLSGLVPLGGQRHLQRHRGRRPGRPPR